MRRSGHIRACSAAARLAVGAIAAALALGGCGNAGAERRDGAAPLLAKGGAASVAELAAARRAAWIFARSYAAALRRPGRVPIRGASEALRRIVVAQRARVAAPQLGPAVRVAAVLLAPRGGSRAEATMILRPRGGRDFPIAFVMRRVGGRWLATALVGG